MRTKLQRLRDDKAKVLQRSKEVNARLGAIEAELKKEEATEIVNTVNKYNMTPEELKEFLDELHGTKEKPKSEKVNQSLYGGQTSKASESSITRESEDKTNEDY